MSALTGFDSLGRPPRIESPYPGWPVAHIATVEAAIAEAMRRVLTTKSSQEITTAKEDRITEWLEGQLCSLLNAEEVPGFDSTVFEQPVRDAETVNFSGDKISKAPDLTFKRLSHFSCAVDTRQDAWFCECKILDGKSGHGVKDYIDEGLMRFVAGDYAWAMPSAQMIGYVRREASKAYAPARQLHDYFADLEPKSGAHYAVVSGLQTEHTQEHVSNGTLPIHATTHARKFLLRNKNVPGEITLRHLWFQMV